jgi:hypothetical protein
MSTSVKSLLFASSFVAYASSFPTYILLNPNGNNVTGVAAIGHVNPAGGGANNKYGIAFANNLHAWNLTLACADSDGDGWPNGFELGDPCGVWKFGGAEPLWVTDISHPGQKASVPLTRGALPVNYAAVCGTNPCASADNEQSSLSLRGQRK